MLAYLNALCLALLEREKVEIHRLMRHPLARYLPRRVRDEVAAIQRARRTNMMAPIHTLHFYHQTAQLVLDQSETMADGPQLELPFRPAPDAFQLEMTVARARRIPA